MPVKKSTSTPRKTTVGARGSAPRRAVVSHSDIARRAYDKFVARGRQPGHELQDWLEAERELLGTEGTARRRKTRV